MILGRVVCDEIKVIEWRKPCDFKIDKHFDIWKIHIPDHLELLSTSYEGLHEDEKIKYDSYKNQDDQNRYVLSKYFLRELIGKYINIPPSEIEFQYSEFNKPRLKNNTNFNFNISHSKNYIIIGLGYNWTVGVDIEYMKSRIDLYDMIINCMSNSEISIILDSKYTRAMFFKFWTRKESLLKGIGIGLTDRIKDVTCIDGVNLVPYDLSSFVSHWKVWSFQLDNLYSVSIAHDSEIRVIRFYEI